jgi:hypothetical protein
MTCRNIPSTSPGADAVLPPTVHRVHVTLMLRLTVTDAQPVARPGLHSVPARTGPEYRDSVMARSRPRDGGVQ